MARQQRYAEEELVAKEILRQLPLRAQAEAQMRGPAPGARLVTGRQEIELWNERDPAVDVMNEYARAVAEGRSNEEAQVAATLKAYPNRAAMMQSHSRDPHEQAAYARKMRRLAETTGGVTDVPGLE